MTFKSQANYRVALGFCTESGGPLGTRVIIEGYVRDPWGKEAALPTDRDVVREG